jgi:hypothetical protein
MSKKRIRTRCLVIDASVAEAAGTTARPHPNAAHCRGFLDAVRGICHRVAWSETITSEWDRHKRGFAGQWLLSMRRIGKLRRVQDEKDEPLREAIAAHSQDPRVVYKMLKDVHLIEAALATDFRIVSCDDNARGHFGRLAVTFPSLRKIMWVNPVTEGERAIEWLEAGAPAKPYRRLKK